MVWVAAVWLVAVFGFLFWADRKDKADSIANDERSRQRRERERRWGRAAYISRQWGVWLQREWAQPKIYGQPREDA